MLSIILTILKIIGIILLVILGLLLTVALIVLFVPIRYKSTGRFAKEDDGIKDNILVRVTWLLHIVSVRFELNNTETNLIIKIFGKTLSLGAKESKKTEKTNKKDVSAVNNKEKNIDAVNTTADTEIVRTQKITTESDTLSDGSKTTNVLETTKTVDNRKAKDNKKDLSKDDIKEKKSFKEKLVDIWQKINSVCQKIKNIKAVKDSFIEYLKRDESKLAIKEIKHIIFKVLKHILPQKLHARIKFGFEDPATTGNILGVASVLYGVYGDKLELEPDFEDVVLEGEYKLKGRIRLFNLLVAALKIYKNKWIKDFIAFSKKTVKKI